MKASEVIWYFEKPTIGVCEDCDEFAVYREGKGLICPKCKSQNIKIFEEAK